MKPSQRYRLNRLAESLRRDRALWLDDDPPTWSFPDGRPYWEAETRRQRLLLKNILFAVRYGGSADKSLAKL